MLPIKYTSIILGLMISLSFLVSSGPTAKIPTDLLKDINRGDAGDLDQTSKMISADPAKLAAALIKYSRRILKINNSLVVFDTSNLKKKHIISQFQVFASSKHPKLTSVSIKLVLLRGQSINEACLIVTNQTVTLSQLPTNIKCPRYNTDIAFKHNEDNLFKRYGDMGYGGFKSEEDPEFLKEYKNPLFIVIAVQLENFVEQIKDPKYKEALLLDLGAQKLTVSQETFQTEIIDKTRKELEEKASAEGEKVVVPVDTKTVIQSAKANMKEKIRGILDNELTELDKVLLNKKMSNEDKYNQAIELYFDIASAVSIIKSNLKLVSDPKYYGKDDKLYNKDAIEELKENMANVNTFMKDLEGKIVVLKAPDGKPALNSKPKDTEEEPEYFDMDL